MLTQPFIYLLLLLGISLIAKNQSLMIAAIVLIGLKIIGLDSKGFAFIQSKGINWGITVITIAVLAPIASGDIGFKDLTAAFKSTDAWIALGSGMAVALIAKGGVGLLAREPHITTVLVIGTILAVSLFRGVAVGPLIGAGIAYMIMRLVDFFK